MTDAKRVSRNTFLIVPTIILFQRAENARFLRKISQDPGNAVLTAIRGSEAQ